MANKEINNFFSHYSNGEIDPWRVMSVLKDINPTTIAVLIEDAAHHMDLMDPNKLDPDSVIEARKKYKVLFKQWISEFEKYYS